MSIFFDNPCDTKGVRLYLPAFILRALGVIIKEMSVIDTYLLKLESPEKAALTKLRQIIRKTVPEAEEVISYGMPGFKYKSKYLVGFAAFKDHLSLFPTPGPIEVYRGQLKDFIISKGAVQFTLSHPLPDVLIKNLVFNRKSEIDQSII